MSRLKNILALGIIVPIAGIALIGFFGRMWWERGR